MYDSTHPHVKVVSIIQREAPDGYTSWFDYWKHVTGSRRRTCCAIGCSNSVHDCPVVNIIEGYYGKEWYLIPLCYYHFLSSDEIEVESRANLVSARVDFVKRKNKRIKTVKPSVQPYHHFYGYHSSSNSDTHNYFDASSDNDNSSSDIDDNSSDNNESSGSSSSSTPSNEDSFDTNDDYNNYNDIYDISGNNTDISSDSNSSDSDNNDGSGSSSSDSDNYSTSSDSDDSSSDSSSYAFSSSEYSSSNNSSSSYSVFSNSDTSSDSDGGYCLSSDNELNLSDSDINNIDSIYLKQLRMRKQTLERQREHEQVQQQEQAQEEQNNNYKCSTNNKNSTENDRNIPWCVFVTYYCMFILMLIFLCVEL